VKRWTWTVVVIVLLAFVGCAGDKSGDAEPSVPVATGGEEDAYQTAVFGQQRAEWQVLADQGDAKAQRQLAMMYYLGQGMDRDYATAHEWFTRAAEQGDDVAQMTLGVMSVEGQGVSASNVQGHVWFSLSAQKGNSSAQTRLERLVPEMTPEEIAEAEQLAENWKPRT